MCRDCSLVNPNTLIFQVSGCTNSFDKCSNTGHKKLLFKVTVPAYHDKGILSINISNIITGYNLSKSIPIPDPKCVCAQNCDSQQSTKDIEHIVAVEFDNLIKGDKYIGNACFEYIGECYDTIQSIQHIP